MIALALLALAAGDPPRPATAPRPRLVVVITVDQLVPGYFERWRAQLSGGLGRMAREGAFFTRAYQDHAVTETAPGHSTVLSGRWPRNTGIISNGLGVGDSTAPLVEANGPGASPRRFRGTALFDWMFAADTASRAFSVSRKDRAAILPIGRARQHVYWYQSGLFTTSRYYADSLPVWVRTFNGQRVPFKSAGREWLPLLADSAYAEPDAAPWENGGRDGVFPHRLPADSVRAASAYAGSPFIDSLTLAFALTGVEQLRLGRRGSTDLLAVGLSATDAVGHTFGPDSRELHDHLLRLDRWLGGFLDSLAVLAPGGVVLALTSDHGVQPWPEAARSAGRDAGRVEVQAWVTRTRDSLAARWGTDFGLRFDHGILLADLAALRARGVDTDALAARLATGLRSRPGIAAAWSPRELAALPPDHELAGLWRRQLPPDLQWAAVATPREGWLWAEGSSTTGHETPALLDRAVPVVFWGVGVPARRCDAVIRTVDIAPTLAALLRVAPTESLDGTAVPLDRCGRPGR